MKRVAVWTTTTLLAFPVLARAALVPYACEDPNFCGTCEFVKVINNIIQFVVQISTLLAVAAFIYAGFLMVTSQGNEGQVSQAKKIFTNVVIGLVIILAAFIIVNTVLAGLLKTGSPVYQWQTIECVYPASVANLRTDTYTNNPLGYATIGGFDNSVGLAQFQANSGVCGSDFLTPIFGDSSTAAAASCIARRESACGSNLLSVTDRNGSGVPFSIGAFQINTTVHPIIGCGQTLNCPDAWSGTNYSAVIVNQSLYEACKNALLDPTCSAINAQRIMQNRGSWRDWSTAAACGL